MHSACSVVTTMEVTLSDCNDNTRKVMDVISRTRNCVVENLIEACPDLTWNQVFLEVDRLSRSGQIVLTRIRPGRYRVDLGREAITVH